MSIISMGPYFMVIGYDCMSHILLTPVKLAGGEQRRLASEQKMMQARPLLGRIDPLKCGGKLVGAVFAHSNYQR